MLQTDNTNKKYAKFTKGHFFWDTLYKKIFEINIIRLTMAEIKQFSIIQAFTALWETKDKEMASFSKFILNLIKTDKIEMTFTLVIKNQQESGIFEQNIYDFEMTAISFLLISQRAVKA